MSQPRYVYQVFQAQQHKCCGGSSSAYQSSRNKRSHRLGYDEFVLAVTATHYEADILARGYAASYELDDITGITGFSFGDINVRRVKLPRACSEETRAKWEFWHLDLASKKRVVDMW